MAEWLNECQNYSIIIEMIINAQFYITYYDDYAHCKVDQIRKPLKLEGTLDEFVFIKYFIIQTFSI